MATSTRKSIGEYVYRTYQNYKAKGYEIVDVELNYPTSNCVDQQSRAIITTPYKMNGNPVKGYVIAETHPSKRDKQTSTVPIQASYLYKETAPNHLEPLYLDEIESSEFVNVKTGEMATVNEVLADLEDTMSSGARYPHIMMYPEFMGFASWTSGMFDAPPPTVDDYREYLRTLPPKMAVKDVEYIGRIKTSDQLDIAWATCPSSNKKKSLFKRIFEAPKAIEDLSDRWVDADEEMPDM